MLDMSLSELREFLTYDPETGIFTWSITLSNNAPTGKKAGCLTHDGYWKIRIKTKECLAHRLAWFYMTGKWPSSYIDHKDGNKLNNKFSNLREVTRSGNQHNMWNPQKNSKSGILGVSPHKPTGLWRANICLNNKRIELGLFETKEQAREAYLKAKRELHPCSEVVKC